MRNPLFVILFSLDHWSSTLTNVYEKIGVFKFLDIPFEHYCVFCHKYVNCWWENYPKSYFKEA